MANTSLKPQPGELTLGEVAQLLDLFSSGLRQIKMPQGSVKEMLDKHSEELSRELVEVVCRKAKVQMQQSS